jgi:hypothetical protein
MPLKSRRVAEDNEPSSLEIPINCPITNQAVSTGIKNEWVVFKSLPPVSVSLRCEACGRTHNWKPNEAWVGRAPRPSRLSNSKSAA